MRWIVLSILIGLFHASCDSVNTDEAEESALNQYQKTHTGTFAAETHSLNYWNSSLSISCTNENPVTFSFNNLNPAGVKNYYFNTVKDLPVSSVPWLQLNPSKTDLGHKVTGWSVPGSVNDIYTVHAWLKNTFDKGVYAGDASVVYDTTSPVFTGVFNSASKTPVLTLYVNDLSLDPNSITITTGSHNFGDPGIPCSGIIQLSEDNFATCLPFQSLPTFTVDPNDKFKNLVSIQAPELAESTQYYVKIEGAISDCPGNSANVSQTQNFMTSDTGPPFIVNSFLSSNNAYDNTSLAKQGDTITLKFMANERLSETGTSEPRNSPKVEFWYIDNITIKYQADSVTKVISDVSGRTWNAIIDTSSMTRTTSTGGDNISYRIYDYWDLAKDAALNYAPNTGVDNYTSTTDNSFITYDNVIPTLLTPRRLLTNNINYSTLFKVGEKAYIDFVVDNESIYTPSVNIGGFDNTTITGGPRLWSAEYTYNDNNTPDNDSVLATIKIVDMVGNINNYTSDNTVEFDKIIQALDPLTIISNNTVRRINSGTEKHHYAKLGDNVTLNFTASEHIIINYVTIGVDNVSDSNLVTLDNNTIWRVNYKLDNNSLTDGELEIKVSFTDRAQNDNYTADRTTDLSKVIFDKTPPQLTSVKIKSNNGNSWMAKSGDNVSLEFYANEKLKNETITCYSTTVSTIETGTDCPNSIVNLFGDDNTTTLVPPIHLTPSNFKGWTTSRSFSTSIPKTAQAGDNVTFTIQFEDYAGNIGTRIISSTTDNSTVTYDDQVPVLSPILITSDNFNSSGATVDKRLAMPGDNITLNFITPEALDNLTLEFANETVSPTLVGDNYTFIKRMDDNDTIKTFNSCANRITGCQVPFQIVSTDFAGNQSTHNQTGTTDNSTVKFDGINPDLTSVNFSTDNCNVRAGKVGDRQTLIATASEPLLQSSVLVHFLSDNGSHQDNFTAPSQISLNFSGTSGDLASSQQLSADRVFTSTDVEGPISFYSYFTDPAGNSNENLNTTTDTSSVTFDRSIPKLNNISVSTDNDPGFDNHSMPGTKINVIFKANEELRALNNNYCTNNCCINPYVVRRYCDNSSIDCTDNVSTDPTKNSYADQEHTVDSGHTDWTNGFRHYSTDTTSLNGDSFYFEIHYLDWAGNPGVIRYTPDDNKTITYDDVRPTLAEVLVKSNNWNTNVKYVAKTGDNITLTYTLPANLRSPPPSVGLAQRTTSSYNSITPTSLGSNRYEAIYTMTDNDIEGRVDFEIVFKDIAGNQEIVRMDRKHTNNCKVPSPLLISPVGTLCNSWSNDNLTHNLVMETGTTDGSFVVFDRTPPSMLLTPIADEKSVIDEIVKLRFHDLTGLLSTTSSVYTGYDNFSGSSFYPSGPTDNMSTVYCNTPIELTDNRSNFTDCYPIFRVGKSNGNPSDNRTKALADIPIRWQSYDCCDTPRGKTTNNYRQSFEVVRNDLQTAECPIRPSQPCRANLFPNSLIKAKLRTNISDLAGNILNPLEVGGDNITESFETYRRPFVRSHTPSDNETGVSVNINPTLTFNIPQTNNTSNDNINKKWEKNYNSSESDTPRGNVNLDPDCLITDNHTSGTKGSISIDPSPNSGFTLGYLSSSTSGFNTITLRPSGPLDSGTIYTVTVQNDVHPGPSFCRYTEKIAPLNRFQFSFKTVDNITRGLIAHYPLNNNTLDHSNIDNNVWNDGTKTAGVTTTNGRDENSNGAYDFNTGQIEIPQNASLEFDDNMSVSMWFYPDTIPTGTSETTLISKSNGNNNFQINLKSGNQIKAEWYDVSSTTVKTLTSCVVKENEWNHLVFTYEKNNKAFLYLNGEFCNSLANGGSLQNPGLDNLFIGSDSGTTYFDGAIDEVKLYNILLGPGEVRDLFVETGRNLSGYYPLGDRNAKDYSGYGYDGSVVGGVSNTSDNDGDTNQASEFNGTSGYIKIPYQNELNAENFTILSWIKPSNSSHTMEGLFSSEDTGRGYGIYKWFYTYSNRVDNNDIASQVLYTDRTNLSLTTPSERCRQRNPPNASYPFQKGTVWGVGCHDNIIDKYFEFWTGSSGASNVNNTNTLVSLRQIDADNTSSLCCTNNYIKHYNSTETAANAIRDTKLTLNGTSYYDIETVSDKWIFMVVTYDGTEKKVGLRNYFDSANSPDLTFKTKTKSESLYLRNTNAARELFIGTGRGSGINTNVNNYFYTGKMDEVRIYNRVLKDVELNAIYNTADTEPPVPGGSGNINTGISWTAAIDDHTATASLEYKVVSTANNQNRISNVESALRNGTVQMDWTANVSNHGYNTANTFVTVLVRDKAGNISSYGVRSL